MEWPVDFPDDHDFLELLVPRVSSELDFEQLLKSTEEKLNLNASSIEQQLKELQAKLGDAHTGERPLSPSEFLQCFNLRAHTGVRPVTTGHQELMDFLRALQQYLRSDEEGKEETTLQLLLNLSSQCGVCFPCTPSSSSLSSTLHPVLMASSIHLVHTVRDDASLEIQEAWDDVRLQLRRHLLDRLSSHSQEHPGPRHNSSLSIPERIQCLQQLLFLYPESEVLTHYQVSQSVLVIMHSALSCSPGGETGFDRLALGFRSVVPALFQALREELYVLSRLAEPHTVLGFLNAAYLSTVARELTSLVEGECETALRGNTTLSSKIKKYSARSRATVDINWLLAHLFFFFQAHVLEFNWRSAFRGLVPHMEHCVKVVLDDVCARSLQQEEASHYLVSYQPYFSLQFCRTIVAELDALLPLAASCRDSSLLEVQSSFVEACSRAAFAMLGRLQERALEVPSSAPLKNLPALLSTCIYVHQRLEPLTLLPIQKYQDTVVALKDQLTSYCVQVCSTCILQDAESHHWADPKPFYEGERCSFSVQMWFYFLCGLRSDLWAVLPAEMAKEVLGQVLSETLQLLVQRYARACPSYKRHLQIRYLCTSLISQHTAIWTLNHFLMNCQLGLLLSTLRDGLMGQTAFACQLRLLTSDPGHNPKLLLRMLLYRECHLPRILLENSCKSVFLFVYMGGWYSALLYLCHHLLFLSDTTRTVPVVISCIRAIVTKSTNSLLVHLVSMVMGWQVTEELSGALFKRKVPERVLVKIPKEWNYIPLEARVKESKSKHGLAIQAVSFIFTNLPLAVASVPLTIRYMFQVAETHLSQHARQLRVVGLLLWTLLSCLIHGLEDLDTLEQMSGLALDRGAKDRLSLLAECLQATMGVQQKVLEEKRPKWINMQLQKARKLCTDSVFERGKESGVAAAELTEQKIGLMLLEVCHKAGGSDYLRQIYHIIQGNEVGKHSLSPAIRWLLA
uniref:Uncharacterized protein n=1 Tax=Anabas testudineus TaxID=64144 RepID=A0AAQ6IIW2_ANATE